MLSNKFPKTFLWCRALITCIEVLQLSPISKTNVSVFSETPYAVCTICLYLSFELYALIFVFYVMF